MVHTIISASITAYSTAVPALILVLVFIELLLFPMTQRHASCQPAIDDGISLEGAAPNEDSTEAPFRRKIPGPLRPIGMDSRKHEGIALLALEGDCTLDDAIASNALACLRGRF